MTPVFVPRRRLASVADLLVILVLGTAIYGLLTMTVRWRAEFHPVTAIDLSFTALPKYAVLSATRGMVAYILSLLFTLIVGYAAAKSRKAERVIIPMIDILQSIPPLGFLPGLALGLIALFPHSNTGLELVCIITIFTSQVWNMTFSYYSSLKSVPGDFQEAARVMGLSWIEKLERLEIPFAALGLAWNSLMSMAGGWFFLIACEAFSLGDHQYRLPGLGAYMAVAFQQNSVSAMIAGVVAMILVIVVLDFAIWRPILSWVRRFRLEDVPGVPQPEPVMLFAIRESRVLRYLHALYRRRQNRKRRQSLTAAAASASRGEDAADDISIPLKPLRKLYSNLTDPRTVQKTFHYLEPALWGITICGLLFGTWKLGTVLVQVDLNHWGLLWKATGFTFLRILGAVAISTLWAVPVGIWIGMSARRTAIARPIVQVLASFPAPMIYPIACVLFLKIGMNLNWSSMFLMLMGVQWYVLFNVLAGALRIPQELNQSLNLMKISVVDRWKSLYLPSVFPALVTGWLTAAGGAWNASMVAEYVQLQHSEILTADGLGSTISAAAAAGDYHMLAASLTVMVIVVIALNRTFWAKLHEVAQKRFRMDL